MVVTPMNQGRSFVLTGVTPRELSILISALDYTLAGCEESGIVPEPLVPREAKDVADPTQGVIASALTDARRLKDAMAVQLPNWSEVV